MILFIKMNLFQSLVIAALMVAIITKLTKNLITFIKFIKYFKNGSKDN